MKTGLKKKYKTTNLKTKSLSLRGSRIIKYINQYIYFKFRLFNLLCIKTSNGVTKYVHPQHKPLTVVVRVVVETQRTAHGDLSKMIGLSTSPFLSSFINV